MLQAYFDGSGEHTSTDFVCLAGYVADDSHWDKFCRDWYALLQKHQIAELHMREFNHGSGQYAEKGWTPAERDAILTEFVSVIREHVQLGVGIGFDTKFYRTMPAAIRKAMDPQLFVFQRVLRTLVEKLKAAGHDAGIALIFDDDNRYAMKWYAALQKIKKARPEAKRSFGSICFGDDRYIQPLQGSDVLAYLSFRYMKAKAAGEVAPDTSPNSSTRPSPGTASST
ncbi:MAG: DUF3800 domain-containing protein [Acidobacteriota bacterium]|nr:DUF3800 domain-containing protein [Acidobacteriota bacterium]